MYDVYMVSHCGIVTNDFMMACFWVTILEILAITSDPKLRFCTGPSLCWNNTHYISLELPYLLKSRVFQSFLFPGFVCWVYRVVSLWWFCARRRQANARRVSCWRTPGPDSPWRGELLPLPLWCDAESTKHPCVHLYAKEIDKDHIIVASRMILKVLLPLSVALSLFFNQIVITASRWRK